jgi:hypothetical protein
VTLLTDDRRRARIHVRETGVVYDLRPVLFTN